MLKIERYTLRMVRAVKKRLGRDNENSSFYILILAMLVIFIFGLNIFLDLAEALSANQLYIYDYRIQSFIVDYRNPAWTPFITFITDLGDRYAYMVVIGIMAALLIIRRNYQLVFQILFVSGLSAVATVALKHTYMRERPSIEHLVEIGGLSFPSGHSLSAMAFYGFVIYLIFRYVRSTVLRWSLSIFCALLILAIGLSRIYVGVHYPSDVAAGFVGGLIWASFCIMLFNLIDLWRLRRKRKRMIGKADSEIELTEDDIAREEANTA